MFQDKNELPIGESNPGRERDRLECYQLHQPGYRSDKYDHQKHPRRDSNPRSPAPETGALATGPRGHTCNHTIPEGLEPPTA